MHPPSEELDLKGSTSTKQDDLLPPPKFNIAPEKRWLEDDPFLLGFGNFSGANC